MPNGKVLNPPPGPEEFLTIEEVSRLTNRTVGGLYMGRTRGLPPGSLGVLWGNRLWFRRSDIQRWLDERLNAAFDERWKHRNDVAGRHLKPAPKTYARQLLDEKKAEAKQAADA